MPFIAWFVTGITSLVTYLTAYIGKKWAVRTAVIAGLVALTAAFTAGLAGLVTALSYGVTDQWFRFGLSLMPANTLPCIGAYISASVMRYIYDRNYSFTARWLDGGL